MSTGWIRAYRQEIERFGFKDASAARRNDRALFRAQFRTTLLKTEDPAGESHGELAWGDAVDLPEGLASKPVTAAIVNGQAGFIRSDHVVQVAYVRRRGTTQDRMKAKLTYTSGGKTHTQELIWGDCVQILEAGEDASTVRCRGYVGQMRNSDLSDDALLEIYFIDVGQGDGVLVRTPDGRHLLVDGGLERAKQLTGKNAADFVDWKFFHDYGDHRIRLDSMTASHSDNDHYGGLHDLVRVTPAADRELDCLGTDIATLHHPGLSRWESRPDADPPHVDGLGPAREGYFVRLLGDRADAQAAIVNGSADELSGSWKWFLRDVINNSAATAFQRVGIRREHLDQGGPLPVLWPDAKGCSIRVLAPITVDRDGKPAMPDLGPRSINTNGHSICLRIDYQQARILLTGDLNKASMDWLRGCYGDRLGVFACDVAKACHHGSHDISYRFLEAMCPAATIISSGDAEGHAHPRPEIVGASALSGFHSIDREKDALLTPLIYMTEVERSVSLGAVNRIRFEDLPVGGGAMSGSLPGRYLDELTDRQRLSPTEEKRVAEAPPEEQAERRRQLVRQLKALEGLALDGTIKASYYYSVPQGPLSPEHKERSVWRSRIMEKNHYGLVNVRTDGAHIMCATRDETAQDWIIHGFPARFTTD